MGVTPPNASLGGSANRGNSASPMPAASASGLPAGMNPKFDLGDALAAQRKSSEPAPINRPESGSVPVFPWSDDGHPAQAAPLDDAVFRPMK